MKIGDKIRVITWKFEERYPMGSHHVVKEISGSWVAGKKMVRVDDTHFRLIEGEFEIISK